jgi:hypothetical protein
MDFITDEQITQLRQRAIDRGLPLAAIVAEWRQGEGKVLNKDVHRNETERLVSLTTDNQ